MMVEMEKGSLSTSSRSSRLLRLATNMMMIGSCPVSIWMNSN